ncbi:flagellar biosynthetic protein FliR [candidate division KSB1 bacterium]
MEYINITFHQFVVFFIGFIRIATIIATVPIFGFNSIPIPIKIGLSFFISWILFPMYEQGDFIIPVDLLPFVLMCLKEVVVGLIIGISTQFIFIGIQMAGELVGLDMGFGMVNILDPTTGEHVSIIGQFNYLLAILIFLAINGHHFLLNALQSSFVAIPLGMAKFRHFVTTEMITMSKEIFIVAVKIGAPALVALFLTSFVMGIIARMVPQMNIFIVGFPLKISVGLVMIWVSIPMFGYVFTKLFGRLENSVIAVIQAMG